MNIQKIKDVVSSENAEAIAICMRENNLSLNGNKIMFDKKTLSDTTDFYDKRQLVRKILLNSALNPSAFVQ